MVAAKLVTGSRSLGATEADGNVCWGKGRRGRTGMVGSRYAYAATPTRTRAWPVSAATVAAAPGRGRAVRSTRARASLLLDDDERTGEFAIHTAAWRGAACARRGGRAEAVRSCGRCRRRRPPRDWAGDDYSYYPRRDAGRAATQGPRRPPAWILGRTTARATE